MKNKKSISLILVTLMTSLAVFSATPVLAYGEADPVFEDKRSEASIDDTSNNDGRKPSEGYILDDENKEELSVSSGMEFSDSIKSGNIEWSVSGNTLVISGSGAMDDYETSSLSPWYSSKDVIESVVIKDGVTSVGKLAFYECSKISKITIPASVTSLNEAAFYECTSLNSITFVGQSKLTNIGQGCFYGCSSLSEFVIPDSVKTIESYFIEGTSISTIVIPKSVNKIDAKMFIGAGKIEYIEVESGNTAYKSVGGIVYSKNQDILIVYPCAKKESVFSFPSTVKRIYDSAFQNASNLTSVNLNNVMIIDDWAFDNSGLENIVLPDCVTTLGNGILCECVDLESVEFGAGIKDIPYRTCYEDSALKSVVIKGAETIGQAAFIYCGLQNITIPACVKEIGVASFGACNLETVEIKGATVIAYQAFADNYNLTQLKLNSGLKTIYGQAFRKADSLGSVEIPATCTFVHESAFPTTVHLINNNQDMKAYGSNGYVDTLTITGKFSYSKAYEVLKLVNNERKKAGLSELAMDKLLLDDAMMRAAEIVVHFSHGRPEGSSVVGYWSWFSFVDGLNIVEGENIACYQSNPEAVMESWMNSAGHKENILGEDWETIGVGCFEYNGKLYWVQTFSSQTTNIDFEKPKDVSVSAPIHIEKNSFYDNASEKDVNYVFAIKGKDTLSQGKSGNLNLTLGQTTFNANSVDWTTSNSGVLKIDKNGKVTGVKSGTVTIKAYSRGYERASKKITVLAPGEEVTSVTLDKKSVVLDKKATTTLKATVSPGTAKDKSVTWKSSNKNIATVDKNGKVTGVKQGVTKITITTNNARRTATATVRVLFDDVKKSHTFYNPIYWAADKGITYGVTGTNKFAPADTVTRGQVIAFLYRINGNPKTAGFKNSFKDVTSKSTFYNPILWGGKSKVVEGYPDGTFRERTTCTRGQIVAFLWRMAGKPNPVTKISPFKDVNTKNPFYKAILWASEKGITVGYNDGTFRSNGNCTRAQMVAFLQRYTLRDKKTVKVPFTKMEFSESEITKLSNYPDKTTVQINVNVTPNMATIPMTDDDITFTCSDTSIATVKKGDFMNGWGTMLQMYAIVTFKKTGTVTITAKSNSGKTAKCKITVL